MADTGGTGYSGRCAGAERGGATAARAVCAEVLSVVHGSAVCNRAIGYRLWAIEVVAEALGIGERRKVRGERQ